MDNHKIRELNNLLSILQESTSSVQFHLDEEYKCFIIDVDLSKDFIGTINMLGRIGAIYNVVVTIEPEKHYRISLIDFNGDWKKVKALFP